MAVGSFLNGDDNGNGTPTWMKAAVRLGVPALIALALVWFLAGDVKTDLRAVKSSTDQITVEHAALAEHATRTDRGLADLQRLLIRICSNTAKTDYERNVCFQ